MLCGHPWEVCRFLNRNTGGVDGRGRVEGVGFGGDEGRETSRDVK